MIETIVTIGGVLATIVALIDLVSHLKDPERQGLARIFINILVASFAIGFVLNFVYFAPKAAGDKFIEAWRNLDGDGLLRATCEDGAAYQDLVGTTGIFDIGSALGAGAIIDNQNFSMFSNEMRFDYRLASFMGNDEPNSMELHIKAQDAFTYCVDSIIGIERTTIQPSQQTEGNVPIQSTQLANSPEGICGSGWTLRLVDVEEELTGNGWKTVTAYVAFQNISSPFVANTYDTPVANYVTSSDLTAVSSEGFSYEAYWDTPGVGGHTFSVFWIPTNFSYLATYNGSNVFGQPYIEFRAAETTTGYVINTNCGNLDLSEDTSHITFPSDNLDSLTYVEVDETIELPEGNLVITGIDSNCGSNRGYTEVCFDLDFSNNSQGYESDPQIEVRSIDASGVISECTGEYLVAGPGQTAQTTITCLTFSDHDRVVMLIREDGFGYWLLRIP